MLVCIGKIFSFILFEVLFVTDSFKQIHPGNNHMKKGAHAQESISKRCHTKNMYVKGASGQWYLGASKKGVQIF